MGAGAKIEVKLLGELAVTAGGKPVALPASKKTRALLGFLAVTGAPQLRSQLCDLLWQGPDDPRGALRWSLTKLRSALGEACFRADRERAELVRAAGVACDLDVARQGVAGGVGGASTAALTKVAASFRGELLEGLDLPDCFRWHEWCVGQREALRALRVSVLAELAERHAGEPEAALVFARQRLAVDPIAEGAHVAVVRLLTGLGRNREASEQVDACRRILAEELGAKPSGALLAARLRSDATPTVPPPPVPVFPVATAASVPFVGRQDELRALEAAMDRALSGDHDRTVVVIGEPGIGKTRLVAELAAKAVARGARVLRGRAFEAEMVRPYGPWIDALPELGSTSGEAPADRERLFEGVAAKLRSIAGAGCVVALDDLQWFDEASLALLHSVARASGPLRVLLACTARAAELSENTHAVRLVRALQRDGRLREISLGPLDAASTTRLALAVDAGVDGGRVAAESAGNPFFALELARAARDGSAGTESLGALLADRLDRAEPRARELLPWVAALGRGFGLEVLGKASSASDAEVLAAVEDLERRGILRSDGNGYDFSHDLVRQAAYRRISAPRRRLVHARIARALAELAAGDDALHGDVVHHASLAGDHELAATAAVRAAERCLRFFANDEAARLAETGLAHAAGLPPAVRLPAQVALLQTKVLSGRWFRRAPELEADLERAAREAQDAGMPAEATRALHWLSASQRNRGDFRAAHETTLRVVEIAKEGELETRGRQLVHAAQCLALIERDVDKARSMLDEAASLLPEHERDFTWCWANALVLSYCGMPEAPALVERALELARRNEDRADEAECLIRLVQLALDRGDPALALAWSRELAPVAAKMTEGSEGPVADALDALARVASAVPGAGDHLETAIARLREVDARGMLAYVLAASADLDRAAGRLAQAERRADEALAAAELIQRRSLVASARAALAELALARGDRRAAEEHISAIADDVARDLLVSQHVRERVRGVASKL